MLLHSNFQKQEEELPNMVLYTTLLSLAKPLPGIKVELLAILQTNVQLHHELTAFLVCFLHIINNFSNSTA